MKRKARLQRCLRNLLGAVIILIHAAPFYILITTTFKLRGDNTSRWLLPQNFSWVNYATALEDGKLLRSMGVTLLITVIATVLIVIIGALAGYPLARYRTKTSRVISLLTLGVMMVPPLSVLVPLYRLLVTIDGLNTYWGIILLSATYGLPLSIFMYSNFISSIPVDLDEAALIDGCSRYSIFLRIILPSLKPVTASVIILSGIGIWNDYSFQLYVLQKPKLRTVTLMITNFFGEGNNNLNAAAAATLLTILPLVVIYLFLSKYFVQGVVDSAVK